MTSPITGGWPIVWNALRNTRPTITMAVSAMRRCASASGAGPGIAGAVSVGAMGGGADRPDP